MYEYISIWRYKYVIYNINGTWCISPKRCARIRWTFCMSRNVWASQFRGVSHRNTFCNILVSIHTARKSRVHVKTLIFFCSNQNNRSHIHIYIYIYIYTYIYIYVYTYIYIYIFIMRYIRCDMCRCIDLVLLKWAKRLFGCHQSSDDDVITSPCLDGWMYMHACIYICTRMYLYMHMHMNV